MPGSSMRKLASRPRPIRTSSRSSRSALPMVSGRVALTSTRQGCEAPVCTFGRPTMVWSVAEMAGRCGVMSGSMFVPQH